MNMKKTFPTDPFILLSWINMKLRDEFSSLNILCEEYEITIGDILEKLNHIGYKYNEKTNQFISSKV